MTTKATGKLRRSFAIAGAAVVLPLLAVFLFNTLWGYLPLRRDVGKVPHFVYVTNSMRDLEVAVLQSAVSAHNHLARGDSFDRARAEAELQAGFDRVKQRFTSVRAALADWPQLHDEIYRVYANWLVVREQARTLLRQRQQLALEQDMGTVESNRQLSADSRAFDIGIGEAVADIDNMIGTLTNEVNSQLNDGRLNSQRIYGLTVAIGLMVIMFIMYVNLRLARYVVDPVNGIVGSITQFRDGDYSARTGIERRDEIGALAHAFNEMAADIEQTHEHLSSLSERDPLTGMLNRRGFDPRFERQLKHVETGRQLAAIMIDIDHFKKVNDTYGHAVGDQVLVAVADTVRNCLRAGDFSARFGGEEFVVCMPGEGVETGMSVAERIREAVARLPLCDADGKEFTVTVSAGVAITTDPQTTRNDLLAAADAALYAAKSGGRNQVVLAGSEPALRKAG